MPETAGGTLSAPVGALSVREALAGAASRLAKAGCETPRLDAELLLAEVLGCDRASLVIDDRRELDADADERFGALIARRARREPVAYILGRKEFRRITLAVDARVLVPRPETEVLVDVGASLQRGARVADVGTGSGAIALALKQERPDLSVVAIEASEDALALARENGRRLGLRVEFVHGDLLAGAAGGFDAVLANLPYVAADSALPPEIERYEPAGALLAGRDGLDAIRRLVPMLDRVALTALEVGFDQADAVERLLLTVGFRSVERLPDLAGHDRVVVGRR